MPVSIAATTTWSPHELEVHRHPRERAHDKDIDTRLGSTARAHLASFRADGMIHLTPIWFDWDGSVPAVSRRPPRAPQLAANPRVTILVDEDPRLQHGLAAGAGPIECRGTAELSNDETLIQEVTHRALLKALGAADAEQYTKPLMAEGRTGRHDHAPDLAHLGLQQGGLTERRWTRPATGATRTVQAVRDQSGVSLRRVSGRARTDQP